MGFSLFPEEINIAFKYLYTLFFINQRYTVIKYSEIRLQGDKCSKSGYISIFLLIQR